MRKSVYILLIAAVASLLSACSHDIVYSQFMPIPSDKWAIDSVLRFDYAISDAAADYRMIVYVRHSERYPYQNMWLFIGDGQRQDTIEFYLADDRGQWLGDQNHGFIEMPVLLEEEKHFPDTGAYSLTIQHGMRDSLLRGITDIGVEIIRNGEK
jgi:gliding motility-associated lipoprotein GldH